MNQQQTSELKKLRMENARLRLKGAIDGLWLRMLERDLAAIQETLALLEREYNSPKSRSSRSGATKGAT